MKTTYRAEGSSIWSGPNLIGAVQHDRSEAAIGAAVEEASDIVRACITHDVLVKLVKDAAAALEAHLIAGSTSTADETLNKLLGILDDSKTVAFLRKAGANL